jgi:hypothetical protein
MHMDRVEGRIRAAKWPYFGVFQRNLLFAGLGMWIGAALPWALVLGKALWGAPMAASWVLWAGLITVAGGAVRWRNLAALSGFIGGVVAAYFALWQTTHIVQTCSLSIHCVPGPGVGLVLIGGIVAIVNSYRLYRRGGE